MPRTSRSKLKRPHSMPHPIVKPNELQDSSNNEEVNDRQVLSSQEKQKVTDSQAILNNLILKFRASDTTRAQKIEILSLLPESFTVAQICQVFGASSAMATIAIKLKQERGILQIPQAKYEESLSGSIVSLIDAFYNEHQYSRDYQGRDNSISVKSDDGTRKQIPKKVLLNNLKELHQRFAEIHPELKVGFSKFAELRPRHCVLSTSYGTHTRSVCHHENVNLKLDALNISEITRGWEHPVTGEPAYKALLQRMVCSKPDTDCYHGDCKSCPGVDELEKALTEELDKRMIDTITYPMWVTADSCEDDDVDEEWDDYEDFDGFEWWLTAKRFKMVKIIKDSDNFVESLCEELEGLLWHDYIAAQQSAHLKELKQKLKPGEFIVVMDFSENYEFGEQEKARAYDEIKNQAIIHPMVIYSKEEERGEVKVTTLVGLSDCSVHNTIVVYMFQKLLIKFLKEKFSKVEHIFYYTDGYPRQYKNQKIFMNLLYHYRDFQVHAEWHFFATAHGKKACEEVSGTVRRKAAHAHLRSDSQAILKPGDLYDWASKNLKNSHFAFCNTEDYDLNAEFLHSRYSSAKDIEGLPSFHSFVPSNERYVFVKTYGKSEVSLCKQVF